MIDVRLLGPTELIVDGRHVATGRMIRAVLAMLALDSPTPLRAEEMADRLWTGNPPASAGSVIRTYVSQLRRMLPDGATRIERVANGYMIRLDPHELDVRRFEELVSSAVKRAADPAVAEPLLREALSLWRGTPLAELADDSRALAVAAGLEERRWTAVELLADAQLALGRPADVTQLLEAAITEAPLREQVVARLMLALYRSGRQADAIAAFQRLRRALVEELGLEPSAELRRLEAAILDQDSSLDAPPRRVGNVPAPATSLVGRGAELHDLATALHTTRLLTLTGPGGTGKTRLAIELATTTAWPDGTWFVELAARQDPRDVAAAAIEAMSHDQRADEDPIVTARLAVRGKRMLLILDNCEHVLPAAAGFASELLKASPELTIVATSRASLGLPGELVWPVPPLASPPSGTEPEQVADFDAARLLGERVAAARRGREPVGAEWSAIGRMCRGLDGLPLAIELVAALTDNLPVSDLADMTERGLVDIAASANTPGHHRSLAASIGWSLDLLDPEHRHLLEHVCLLPGAFSVAAAAAVAGETDLDKMAAALAHLARQSLLQPVRAPSARFRVLETIRHVVREPLDPIASASALDRLAAWAADWIESIEPSLRGPDAGKLLDELDGQRDVLYVALDHGLGRPDPTNGLRIAASISALWSYRGYLRDGKRWLTRALAVADSVDTRIRIRVLVAAGTHMMATGDHDSFRLHLEAALSLARAGRADAEAVRVLLWSGHACALHDDHSAAGALYDEALRLALEAQDRSSTASALAGLGDVAAAREDLDAAAALHLRALAEFRAAGDAHGQGQALLNVADVERRAGRVAESQRLFHDAARVFESIDDRSCIAATNEGLARVAADGRSWEEAEARYRAAIEARIELGQTQAQIRALVALAHVLSEHGRPQEAAATLGAAGRDDDALADRLRLDLGDRAYLSAWAEGSARRVEASR